MNHKFIKFGTDWCGGCRAIKPTFEVIKESGIEVLEYNAEIDVEERKKYGVQNLPTVLIVDAEGNEKERFVGRKSPNTYTEAINKYNHEII